MASLDIGIDLGTCEILAGNPGRGILVREPSIVAVNKRTSKIISIGSEVYKMLGRTPDYIEIVRPMSDGIISDYKMTGVLIKYILSCISRNRLIRPRLIICVPSATTGIESQSVIDAAVEAGARQVHLIEEPVAAALGAGLDIMKPLGRMVIDIGGGTSDIAVLSLRGVVCKVSLKTAGRSFDEAIMRYIRQKYGLLVGERTAEEIKIEIGSVWEGDSPAETAAKGRNLVSGLPAQVQITRRELLPILREIAGAILAGAQSVLERTPPELVGDIRSHGVVITGGSALLSGMDRFISGGIKAEAYVADNPAECVAIGTAMGFSYLGKLYGGFLETTGHVH